MPPKQAPRRGAASASSSTRQQPNTPAPDVSRSTTTPGPSAGQTATRQPAQRLQSLKKNAPTGSITTPARSSATPGPGGEQAKPTLKYKPRAVGRRSKEEREAIEKVEAQRHRERLQEAAAIQRGRGGGRGGSGFGRGRGGPMGGGGVGGPLGSGMSPSSGGARRGRGGSRFGPGVQESRTSSMSQRSRTRSVIDLGSGMASRDVSSDESDSGILVDIDQINLDSDEEGPDESLDKKKKMKGKMPVTDAADSHADKSLRPIRVERHEHAERVVSVNMESSSSKSAELRQQAKAKAKDDDDDDALFVPQDDEKEGEEQQLVVKDEPKDDGDQVMSDVPAAADGEETATATDDGLLPEPTVKVRRNLSKEPPAPASPPPAAKDPKSLLRTKEDIEEYERHEQDLGVVKDLLFVEPKEPKEPEKEPRAEQPATEEGEREKPETATEEQEGEEKSAEEEDEAKDKLSGQLFLVQFPPMTPNLVIPGTAGDAGDNGEEGAEAPSTEHANPEPSQPDEQSKPSTIKREDDGTAELLDTTADADTTNATPPKLVTATNQQLPAGRVGKLNVHASGRVTMDWGGISFDLDKATDVDFLQEAMILSTVQDQQQEGIKEEQEEKRAWAMGQLSGKFTVTPDWESIL